MGHDRPCDRAMEAFNALLCAGNGGEAAVCKVKREKSYPCAVRVDERSPGRYPPTFRAFDTTTTTCRHACKLTPSRHPHGLVMLQDHQRLAVEDER